MLGVREPARNMGVGRMLKEYQRNALAALTRLTRRTRVVILSEAKDLVATGQILRFAQDDSS